MTKNLDKKDIRKGMDFLIAALAISEIRNIDDDIKGDIIKDFKRDFASNLDKVLS